VIRPLLAVIAGHSVALEGSSERLAAAQRQLLPGEAETQTGPGAGDEVAETAAARAVVTDGLFEKHQCK